MLPVQKLSRTRRLYPRRMRNWTEEYGLCPSVDEYIPALVNKFQKKPAKRIGEVKTNIEHTQKSLIVALNV